MGVSRWRKSAVGLFTASSTLALAVALGTSPANSVTIHVQGTATGTAVDVTSPVPPPAGDDGAQVLLSNAHSQIDTDGIGIGSIKAEGAARPGVVFVDGVETLSVAESSTSAPPESTETDSIPDADLGVAQAAVLSSLSKADDNPVLSENHAEAASATVAPGAVPLVTTNDVTGHAITQQLGDPTAPKGKSDGAAGIATARVEVPDLLVVEAEVITAEAHALVTGSLAPRNSSSASASCTILNLTINGIAFPAPPCDGSTLLEIPGVLAVTTGQPSTTVEKNKASASIDALTITLATGQKIVLAHADAAARRITTVPGNPCEPTEPLATASALGQVGEARLVNDAADVDVVKASGAISTHGVDNTKHFAVADGEAAHAASPIGPVDVAVADSHAKAPPNSSDSAAVVATPAGSPVAGTVLASTATALGPLSFPSANATADAAEADDMLTPLALGVDVGSAAANAARLPATPTSPSLVTASSSASAADVSVMVGTTPVTVDVIEATAVATANGLPGGADASTGFHIARITVGLVVIEPVPSTPGTVLDVLGLVRLTIGNSTTTESADGTTATASVDALTIQSLLTGDQVVLGHAEASVQAPSQAPSMSLRHRGDVGDDGLPGSDLHAGDVIRLGFCLNNRGGVALTGIQMQDQLHPALEVLDVPAGATVNGQLVTTAPFTLQAGQAEVLSIVVRVRDSTAPGTRLGNFGTATADQLPGPVASNTISYTVTSG